MPCPERYYCLPVNLTANPYSGYTLCPRGFYCPTATGLNWRPCPRGTYSNNTGLASSRECLDCPAGRYCDRLNAVTNSGICQGGHYCESGVDRADPINAANGTVLVGNCTQRGLHTGLYCISLWCEFSPKFSSLQIRINMRNLQMPTISVAGIMGFFFQFGKRNVIVILSLFSMPVINLVEIFHFCPLWILTKTDLSVFCRIPHSRLSPYGPW